MLRFLLTFLTMSFIIGCSTENPLCTDNYCITGEVFSKDDLEQGQTFEVLPLDEVALLRALENPPPGKIIADNSPSYFDWLKSEFGSKEEKSILEQATSLKQGLILPPNTFALSYNLNILVGHRPDNGKVDIWRLDKNPPSRTTSTANILSHKDINIVIVKHGYNWIVEVIDETIVEPIAENKLENNLCKVGDILQPGDSCKDGTGDDFTVLENGSGKYLFVNAGEGINLFGNINGKVRNFSAEKQEDGSWKIKSVTPKE